MFSFRMPLFVFSNKNKSFGGTLRLSVVVCGCAIIMFFSEEEKGGLWNGHARTGQTYLSTARRHDSALKILQ
jgi:hypothetical protein